MTSRLNIRPMLPADLERVRALWEAAGLPVRPGGRDAPAALAQQLAHWPRTFLVAERDREIIGVILGTHDGRKGWLNRLAVHPQARRQGIGAALVRACEQALLADGIQIVAALTEIENSASQALLYATGYETSIPVKYFRKTLHEDA